MHEIIYPTILVKNPKIPSFEDQKRGCLSDELYNLQLCGESEARFKTYSMI
jgi:hypothetical protein